MSEDRRFLTVPEVAAEWGVSERTIWSLVAKKRLPAVRFGRIVRIDRSDLEAFIRRAKGTSGPVPIEEVIPGVLNNIKIESPAR